MWVSKLKAAGNDGRLSNTQMAPTWAQPETCRVTCDSRTLGTKLASFLLACKFHSARSGVFFQPAHSPPHADARSQEPRAGAGQALDSYL